MRRPDVRMGFGGPHRLRGGTRVLVAAVVLLSGGLAGARAQVAADPVAQASAGTVLTLDQALARAAERSPAVVAATSARDVAEARLRQARSWENPTLEVEVENVLGRGAYSGFDAAETTVQVSQPLPLGGGRAGQLRAARAGLSLAAAQQELVRRELRRELTIAYAEAVAADRHAEISRERGRIAAQMREAVERRFRAGLESELQRSRAEVETSGLQAAMRRAAADSLARRRALAAYWREDTVGDPLDATWFDAPGLASAGDAAAGPLPSASAATGHPRLELARHRVEQARGRLDAARGARFGGIEATVGARRFGDEPASKDRAWVLGFSLPLPLWGRNAAHIAEARAELLEAELEAEREGRGLAAEREAAEAELAAARIEVEALASSGLPSAEAAARLARQGYDAGRLSLLERLDAERSLSELRERLETARLQLRRAEATLESLR